jgi:hypothetical protein
VNPKTGEIQEFETDIPPERAKVLGLVPVPLAELDLVRAMTRPQRISWAARAMNKERRDARRAQRKARRKQRSARG